MISDLDGFTEECVGAAISMQPIEVLVAVDEVVAPTTVDDITIRNKRRLMRLAASWRGKFDGHFSGRGPIRLIDVQVIRTCFDGT